MESYMYEITSHLEDDHKNKGSRSLSQYKKHVCDDGEFYKYSHDIFPNELKHVRCNSDGMVTLWTTNNDKDLVAYISIEKKDDNTTAIQALEVMPNYRGHGLSESLLKYAKTNGVNALWVDSKNEVAKNLYLKHGWKETEDNTTKLIKMISESSYRHSYLFRLEDDIKFDDSIIESSGDKTLYPVYVILMHTGTTLANTIKKFTNSSFSHSSISFDSSLHNMYTFGRKADVNPLIGGFKKEDIRDDFFQHKDILYSLYIVPSTMDEITRMKKRLDYFIQNSSKFKYDFTGLFKNYLGITDNPEYKWFCSRFVADILNAGRPISRPYVKDPFLQRPQDFVNDKFAHYVTGGTFRLYSQRQVDKIVGMMMDEFNNKIKTESQNDHKIFVCSDWHLYNIKSAPHHMDKTDSEINIMLNNYKNIIGPDDILIHLGDVTDPDKTNFNKLKNIIHSIPGYKILCLGNNDTAPKSYYYDIGFDEVCEACKFGNIVFSHKPIIVPSNTINIHGHLHDAKLLNYNGNHIKVYDHNFNGKPFLLDDILKKRSSMKPHVNETDFTYTIHDKYNINMFSDIIDLDDKNHTSIVNESIEYYLGTHPNLKMVSEILLSSTLEYATFDDCKTEAYLKRYKCLKNNEDWLFKDPALSSNPIPKGFIVLDKMEDAIAGYGFVTNNNLIFSVYVFPKYRHRGIATNVVKKLMSEYGATTLEVTTDNKHAINLYSKLGFKIIGKTRTFGENDEKDVPAYVMSISERFSSYCKEDNMSDYVETPRHVNIIYLKNILSDEIKNFINERVDRLATVIDSPRTEIKVDFIPKYAFRSRFENKHIFGTYDVSSNMVYMIEPSDVPRQIRYDRLCVHEFCHAVLHDVNPNLDENSTDGIVITWADGHLDDLKALSDYTGDPRYYNEYEESINKVKSAVAANGESALYYIARGQEVPGMAMEGFFDKEKREARKEAKDKKKDEKLKAKEKELAARNKEKKDRENEEKDPRVMNVTKPKEGMVRKIQNKALDADVKFKRKLAEKRKSAKEAKNAGKAVAKIPLSVKGMVDKALHEWDEADDNRRKEYIIKPGVRKKYWKALKLAILHFGAFAINPILNIVLLISHKLSNSKDIRIRNELVRELKAEIKVTDEKIKDADYSRDKDAKYKLMRIREKLDAELTRVTSNSKFI